MATPIQTPNPAETLGARLLKDIENEERSLESLLKDLRALHGSAVSKTGIPGLDALINASKPVSICGRNVALLYQLLYHQIHTLSGTVALIDLTSTFSPSHLSPILTVSELSHIHIFRATKSNLKSTLEGLEKYLMECKGSMGRAWVGTIVYGGWGNGGDFNFGRGGPLRVERVREGEGFGEAISVQEAIAERRRRQDAAAVSGDEERGTKWKVVSYSREYSWKSG